MKEIPSGSTGIPISTKQSSEASSERVNDSIKKVGAFKSKEVTKSALKGSIEKKKRHIRCRKKNVKK